MILVRIAMMMMMITMMTIMMDDDSNSHDNHNDGNGNDDDSGYGGVVIMVRAVIMMSVRNMELFILFQVPFGITFITPSTQPLRVVTIAFLHFSDEGKGRKLRDSILSRSPV